MQVEQALRDRNIRVTKQRRAILKALDGAGHRDAESIRCAVAAELGTISIQSVYDTLHTLNEQHLVRRIEPAGRPSLFELRVGDNHHHLVCRECSAIEDVDCAIGQAPCVTMPDPDSGFVIDEAEVTWWGLCKKCFENKSTIKE